MRVCRICGLPERARELCSKHYDRWRHHGHFEQTRPADWGAREKHPLWGTWQATRRSPRGRVPEWGDFWIFVKDISPKPEGRHRLFRADMAQPLGPSNFYWKAVIPNPDWAEWQRQYRARNRLRVKDQNLRRNYGISLADYDAMLESQDGCCAICDEQENVVHSNGKKYKLAIDHDHTTKKVRGLLCRQCNSGLGAFRDSTELLKKALEYLTFHQGDVVLSGTKRQEKPRPHRRTT